VSGGGTPQHGSGRLLLGTAAEWGRKRGAGGERDEVGEAGGVPVRRSGRGSWWPKEREKGNQATRQVWRRWGGRKKKEYDVWVPPKVVGMEFEIQRLPGAEKLKLNWKM
jgi:hypothetical protein